MLADLVTLTFDGRVGRGTFAGMMVSVLVLSFGGGFIGGFLPVFGWPGAFLGFLVTVIAAIAGVWLLVSAMVKRLHDIGLSGWFALLGIVPVISILLLIYLLLAPGHRYSNDYGFVP